MHSYLGFFIKQSTQFTFGFIKSEINNNLASYNSDSYDHIIQTGLQDYCFGAVLQKYFGSMKTLWEESDLVLFSVLVQM